MSDPTQLDQELQYLRDLRDLLEPPSRWIKEVYARDASGSVANLGAPDAVCWCLSGAIARISPEYRSMARPYERLLRQVRLAGFASIPQFNDLSTHREVLELIDRAIAEVIAERTASCPG